MYLVDSVDMTPAFYACWLAAKEHLSLQAADGALPWLRAVPNPPFLEHLSFRMGNQLFYIRVEDVEREVDGPGSIEGLMAIAHGTGGHACILPMRRGLGDIWTTSEPGWGLICPESGNAINPLDLITDEKIEMSAWEVHDMAVNVVRTYLEKEGYRLMSSQGNPDVYPSIWFIGRSGKPEWVVVAATTFPNMCAPRPSNWSEIVEGYTRQGTAGHFASVSVVSADQPFESMAEKAVPLWRGFGMHVRFVGLEPV